VRRNAGAPEILRGESLFSEIGCANCHIPEFESGSSSIEAVSFKPVALYSDLLLHDMGPALADGYPEGEATGTEWRTTPLWGLGIVENLLGGTPYYLHDGRTSSLTEVISLHGGEAEAAKLAYLALPDSDQKALIAFLKSL
jgi:CxxC motif-containing protein (DUF1111 family)